MDARLDPATAYGIHLGEAHIIRNAGGSARAAILDIVVSQQVLGTTELFVVKHTTCGMMGATNAYLHDLVAKNLGEEGSKELSEGVFYGLSKTE